MRRTSWRRQRASPPASQCRNPRSTTLFCFVLIRQTQTERSAEEEAALTAIAALRLSAKKDALPACVAPGLFIGGAGAARNLKALRKRGITHIVNAAPCVPCHFRDNPEGFQYWTVPLFDDPDAGGGPVSFRVGVYHCMPCCLP
jgi:hypothetical protein